MLTSRSDRYRRSEQVYGAAVERLLNRLDQDRPNWLTSMPENLNRIDQATVDRCVLSLVYGFFEVGRYRLRRSTGRLSRAEHLVIVPLPWQRDRINRLIRVSVKRRRSAWQAEGPVGGHWSRVSR